MSTGPAVDLTPACHREWYRSHGCDHAHCPDGCEHPQPVMLDDGRFACGRCLFRFNEVVEMVPCTPEHCDQAVEGDASR